jgi:hypothetical protein
MSQKRASGARERHPDWRSLETANLLVRQSAMSRASLKNRHRAHVLGALATGLALSAGCVAEDTNDSAAEVASVTGDVAATQPPVVPAMLYLAGLPAEDRGEEALGALFAAGSADHVPVGPSTGYPVLFSTLPDLNWLASQLWGGKTFRVVSTETHPNGDPIVRLDNKIIKTPQGGILDLFDAYVTRGSVPALAIGTNSRNETVAPPAGLLAPAAVSFLQQSVRIDDKPSIVLNYFEDRSLPIIRRILDEIREVDPIDCPGVYLGRAHVRRCASLACGELPTAIVDFPSHLTFQTDYAWSFWTYFLLNFGDESSTCDLSAAIARAEQELGTDLPTPPSAQ